MNDWLTFLFTVFWFVMGWFSAAFACEYAYKKHFFRFGWYVMSTAWSIIIMYGIAFSK